MSKNKMNPNVINMKKVNFVCPRCQKVYYQADHDDFDEDRKGSVRAANAYRKYYHSCKARGRGKR